MAKLRSGNGTDYPSAIDTDLFVDDNQLEVDNQTIPRAAIPNDLALADIAVQTELGEDPAGSLTAPDDNVKTWLQTEHGTDGTHATGVPGGFSSFTLITPIFDTTYTPTNTIWPSFKAFISPAPGHPAIATGAGFTQIEFDDDSTAPAYDQGSGYDTAAFDFTVPTGAAGKYFFHATVELPGASINTAVTIALYKNTILYKTWIKQSGASAATNIIVPLTAYVENAAANDVFDIRVSHNSSGALTPTSNSANNWFTGFRVA
jgi:hypothetical protein